MMTKEELENFINLFEHFESNCNRVRDILSKVKNNYFNIQFADTFSLCDKEVQWEGDEYWRYGGEDHYLGYFPSEYLCMSDDELMAIVEEMNRKWEEEQKDKEKKLEEQKKAKDLKNIKT